MNYLSGKILIISWIRWVNIAAFVLCFFLPLLVLGAHGLRYGKRFAGNKDPVVIKSNTLRVSIDQATGIPSNYRFQGADIGGADSSRELGVTICRLKPRAYIQLKVKPYKIIAGDRQADVVYKVLYQRLPAVSFRINYVVVGASLVVTMDKVKEERGFELIEAEMPDMATVHEEEGQAWLAHGMNGGEVVDLKNSNSKKLPVDNTFGDIGYVLPVAIIGTAKVACTMEVSAFMDGTQIEISGKSGFHHAKIGTIQVYRVHGGRSYDMNDGGERVKGNGQTPNLLVGQQSRCRFDFTDDRDNNGAVDWFDGASILARRMPKSPTDYYSDKFIYLIAGKYKSEMKPRTTFKQSERLISDIAKLTDYAPQVPLISGWVYDGQDTGFPSEDKVNETLGGKEGLKNLIKSGPKYNANISLNVNYDDAYKSSPLFDTAFIARQPDGKVWKSRDWDGEYSFITGMSKYMEKWGEKRMDYTIGEYKIHDALLIDAMSWFAIRNDWDPIHPASGYKNLIDGKYKIVDGFKKRGVAVISEQLRYPFIGKVAVTADGVGGGASYFGGEAIPLVATIYRKSAIWGTGDFARNDPKRSLFWNCRSIQWYSDTTDRKYIIDYYFMTVLPFNKVHDKAVTGYIHHGYNTEIQLEGNSKIINNWMSGEYSIKADGVQIAGQNSTYCPIDENRVAFFSRDSKVLKAALPAGWDSSVITARALYLDHREPVKVQVEKGNMLVNVIAGTPVIVYRNGDLAEKNTNTPFLKKY